jgi:hypothetical protein
LSTKHVGITASDMMIRSSVKSLTLHKNDYGIVPRYDLLFDRLSHSEAAVRLCSLKIKSVDMLVTEKLSQFLARSSRLQELYVEFPFVQELSLLLLSGIHHNGSLHTVEWKAEIEPQPSSLWLRWVTVCCQRNRLVPKLLAQECVGTERAGQINQCLIPSLLHVVQQARRTAPNTMLTGLLAGSDRVGPARQTTGAKRVSSTGLVVGTN